ncbi:RNA polymerase sigma factor [Jannaschia sp. R86511]|uniref:RNA polymerase sigma factor n=1 Tax=Jannaschia sp. R86511 TaxID=3093853 RepID=UPI0036D27A41
MTPRNVSEAVLDVTDGALARRAALGDREAFAEIFHRHGEAMYRYAKGMLVGFPEDAEDVVQSALLKAWQHLPSYRGESSLKTWLFSITANEVRTIRRRSRPVLLEHVQVVERVDQNAVHPEQNLADRELWEVLDAALADLPPRQREVWILRELDEMSYADIATVLNVTPTTVRGQLHRARRAVAQRMEDWR